MQSMTGFGHAELSCEAFDLAVDVKTVNGRYFDFKVRLPREMMEMEGAFKVEAQRRIQRGRVELFVDLRLKSGSQFELNLPLVEAYLAAAGQLESRGIGGGLTVDSVLALPGVIVPARVELLNEEHRDLLLGVLREALDRVWETRREEGRALHRELEGRIGRLGELVVEMERGADDLKKHYRQKLEKALADWSDRPEVDEARIAQEVVFYLEKSDICEEIARLRSHLSKFRGLLQAAGETAVGRDMDFFCQEMNREVNTILAKSSVVSVTDAGVEAKGEIERVREQVQNVE
jgi:uncharacterized protein (TIGR00255 family)